MDSAVLEHEVGTLRSLVAEVSAAVSSLDGAQAASFASSLSTVARLAETAAVLCARRAQACSSFVASGHRNGAEWLAALSGERVGRAEGRLGLAADLEASPAVEAALVAGEVSLDQAQVIAPLARLDPGAVPGLLAAAAESFAALEHRAAVVRQAALGADGQRRARAGVVARRFLRAGPAPGGGVRGSFLLEESAFARLLAVLDPLAERRYATARSGGDPGTRGAHLADALVDAVCAGGRPAAAPGPRALVHVFVDAAALRRGVAEGDECCEIAGVGPVSVASAKALLGDAFFEFVVRDAQSLAAITSTTRHVPERVRNALFARDRHCRWPGCVATFALALHHWPADYREGCGTGLDTLVTLCGPHHDFCTYRGWRIAWSPEAGSFVTTAPTHPVSEEQVRRRRRLAVQRARARRTPAGRAASWSGGGPVEARPERC